MGICCMTQGTQTGALRQGEGWRVGRELRGRSGRQGTRVYLWLILGDIWQKATKFCKAIILQLKNVFKFKKWRTKNKLISLMISKKENRNQSKLSCFGSGRNWNKQTLVDWVLKSCGSVGDKTPASAQIWFCYWPLQLGLHSFSWHYTGN